MIGRPYPMDRVRAHLDTLAPPFAGQDALDAARAIMTTDTVPKVAEATGRRRPGSSASPRASG